MMKALAPLALVATACSPGGGNASMPANTADAATAGGAVAPVAAASAAAAKPGEVKTFGDWTVGCDNVHACMMRSLGPEDGDAPPTTLLVARDAGGDSGFRVTVEAEDGAARGIAVDGKRVAASKADYDGADAAAIVAAMANGQALQILSADGKTQSSVSLKGASASLRYIDAEQGRAGTVTAAVAKGSTPASSVPAAPPLPVIDAVAPGGTAATPTAALVAQMRKIAECDLDGFAGDATPEVHALGGGATLVLVPCGAGAYNFSAAVFVLKDGKVIPAAADVATGFGEDDVPRAPASVVNGDFEDGLLTSYAKGRGLGDCGSSQKLAWDGTKLRLVEAGLMGECRGNTGLITTWRAEVRRR